MLRVAQGEILLSFGQLPAFRGIGPKAAWIMVAHQDIGRCVYHSAGQFAGQPRASPHADLSATTAPITARTQGWADQWVTFGRAIYRTTYFAINAQISKDYQLVQAFLKPRHHAITISNKEQIFLVPRPVIIPDKIRVFLFVNPDQSALLLNPNIGWHFAVTSGDRFPCDSMRGVKRHRRLGVGQRAL